MTATITNIQGFSIHDGPGIRTVVFFKGCGLACKWCANPEGISPHVQIGFIENLCRNCGTCFSVCPEQALVTDRTNYRIDTGKCTACGRCVDACPYQALVRYGREMRVEEVFDAVRKDKMFYGADGGVTVSGGEPLLQADFVRRLFRLCKEDGIGTCAETSGFVPPSNLEQVLPLTDLLLFDLKHMNPDLHRDYTGQSNSLIFENARLAAQAGASILFRIPLIPSVNDSEENILQTADFVKSIQQKPRIQLMPYHRLGESKYKALNLKDQMNGLPAAGADRVEEVRQKYIQLGIDCSVSR